MRALVKQRTVFARELTDSDIVDLRQLAETPKAMPWDCRWRGDRYLVEDVQSFLWYYDNRANLRSQMALCSSN